MGDGVSTVQTQFGYVSPGVSFATTVYGGPGDGSFIVYNAQAPLTLNADGGDDTFVVRSLGITEKPLSINAGGRGSLSVIATPAADELVISSQVVLGAGVNVGYTQLPALEVNGNGGNDTFTILSTSPDTVTTLDGAQSGSDTFNVGGDLMSSVQAETALGAAALTAPYAGPHQTATLAGQLIINGGATVTPPALVEAAQLPSELDAALPATGPAIADPNRVAALNVFDDLNTTGQTGTLSNAGLLGEVAGLGMGSGIDYSSVDTVDVMLGSGSDTFTVLGTAPGSITLIQGGGGNNDLIADGGGGPLAPLVLFASTSQDGSYYNSTSTDLTGGARIFNDPGSESVLDARDDPNGVTLYGGTGTVTIYGGGGDDQIAGGSGTDVIYAGSGNDDIYGNGGFNLNLSLTLAQSIADQANLLTEANTPTGGESPTADPLTASSQTIYGGAGNDIIFGHWGQIEQVVGSSMLLSTGGLTGIYTENSTTIAGVRIYGGEGSYIVLGGAGNSLVDLQATKTAPNVVIGEDGFVTFAEPQYFQSLGGWFAQLQTVSSRTPSVGGDNTLVLGSGPAVVIGGVGSNFIETSGGNDVILGNDGYVSFATGHPIIAKSADPLVAAHNILAGNTIITGPGNSQIIGGSGNNRITVGAGDSVVIAADGEIIYGAQGMPVSARSLYTSFAGIDQVTIAGSSRLVTVPSPYGTIGAGVVIEPKSGVLHAPSSYLVEQGTGLATYSGPRHGWFNPRSRKPRRHKKTSKKKTKKTSKKTKKTNKKKHKPSKKPARAGHSAGGTGRNRTTQSKE